MYLALYGRRVVIRSSITRMPNTRGARAAADGACTGHRTSGSGSRREDQLPRRRGVFPAREDLAVTSGMVLN